MTKVGVFDSGIGGLSVAQAIETAMPELEVEFVNDQANLPYGTKTKDEILALCQPKLESLAKDGCQVLVVACNTVTTNVIGILRDRMSVPIVAVEPMVKPAAELTKTKVIAVCATPATLASLRYQELKEQYAKDIKVIEPDCSNWTMLIEHKALDQKQIADTIKEALDGGADVIVLGCTHYHWIEKEIKQVVKGKAQVIQPEQAIVRRLQQVLKQLV